MADVDTVGPIAPVDQTRNNTTELDGPLDHPPGRTSSQTLGAFDIASFNINKMIGTGIFTTPGTILLLTGNKTVALAIWIVGWVYTYLGCVLAVMLCVSIGGGS